MRLVSVTVATYICDSGVVCWHVVVGDNHICHLHDSHIKPLIFLLDWSFGYWWWSLLFLGKEAGGMTPVNTNGWKHKPQV